MALVKLGLFLLWLACCSAHLAQDDPNEQCSWRGFKECPIESSGSNPICDNTVPFEVSPGVYGMKICAAETPKAVGGKFDVGLATFGTILTVDVIPASQDDDNNVHCTDGAGSVGTRVFYAHCEISGPGKIRGYWAITYKITANEVELQ
jgi:hypothetical protein